LALLCAVGAVVGAAPLATASAQAAPVATAGTDIAIEWDGPVSQVAWNGQTAGTAAASFVGVTVAVPGDRVERTAIVRNDGPSDAEVTVELVNLTTLNPSLDQGFEQAIRLYWNVNGQINEQTWWSASLAQAATGVADSASFSLAQGASFPLTVGYRFPEETTVGHGASHTSTNLSFDLRVTMTGEDATAPAGPNPGTPPNWAHTGGAGGGTLAAVAGLGLFLGLASLVAAKLTRRRASVAQR